jgi:hypothetical protein
MSKRTYTRRTEEEKIAELSAKIDVLKRRMELKQRKDGPVFRELKRVKKILTRFCQTANDCEREDLSTMTEAFLAGLERSAGESSEPPRRRGRAGRNHHDDE